MTKQIWSSGVPTGDGELANSEFPQFVYVGPLLEIQTWWVELVAHGNCSFIIISEYPWCYPCTTCKRFILSYFFFFYVVKQLVTMCLPCNGGLYTPPQTQNPDCVGVTWAKLEIVVRWSPVESGGVWQTPVWQPPPDSTRTLSTGLHRTQSSGLQWTPMDSGGIQRTPVALNW